MTGVPDAANWWRVAPQLNTASSKCGERNKYILASSRRATENICLCLKK
jgi:hypothetical protein